MTFRAVTPAITIAWNGIIVTANDLQQNLSIGPDSNNFNNVQSNVDVRAVPQNPPAGFAISFDQAIIESLSPPEEANGSST